MSPFTGEYLEIDRPRSWKQTFAVDLDGLRDQVGLETFTLEEVDGGTRLIARSAFGSIERARGRHGDWHDRWRGRVVGRLAEVLAEG